MRGERVTFVPQVVKGKDGFGNVKMSDGDPFDVDGVMVAPSTSSDIEDGRPHGSNSKVTLYFDHDDQLELRGSVAVVRGLRFKVQGSPMPYFPGELRDKFGYEVEAVRIDG